MYVDPTGEFFWYAVAIGAVIGGVSNYADGGSFLAGAALGAVSGAISGGIGCGVQALGLSSTMTLMLSSTISGGITSVVFGGSLSDGLKAGAISGAVAGVVRFACLKTSITNPGVISAVTGAAGAAISDGDPLEAAVTGFISGAITAGVANRQAQQRAARIMSLQEQPATNSHYDLPEECNDLIVDKSYYIDAVLEYYSNRTMSNVAASFDATYEEGIGQLNTLTEEFTNNMGYKIDDFRNEAHRIIEALDRNPITGFVEMPFVSILGCSYGKRGNNPVYWGKPDFVEDIMLLASYWNYKHPNSTILFNDISNADGSKLGNHSSHMLGKDVDMYIIWNGKNITKMANPNLSTLGLDYIANNSSYQNIGKGVIQEFVNMVNTVCPNRFNDIIWCDPNIVGVDEMVRTNINLRTQHQHHIHLGY